MLDEDRVMDIIRLRGPVIPIQIARELRTEILFASAMLSALASKDKVFVSHVKVGGSPVYYIRGQEEKLQNYINSLNEKEKQAFNLLKEKKILRDNILEKELRVALRGSSMKDFAKPIHVNVNGGEELFWRWYLLSDDETRASLDRILQPKKEEVKEKKKRGRKKKVPGQQEITSSITEQVIPVAIVQQDSGVTLLEEINVGTKVPKTIADAQVKEEIVKAEVVPIEQRTEEAVQIEEEKDSFLDSILEFLKKKDMEIVSKEIVKKESEIDMVVKVPSSVGKLEYSCKAKNRKIINEGDLAYALIQGQAKRLPVIFLTNGELNKRAKEVLDKEIKGLVVVKLE